MFQLLLSFILWFLNWPWWATVIMALFVLYLMYLGAVGKDKTP